MPPPPTHPLTEIPGITHERHTRIKSGGPGPLTNAVYLFNDQQTVKGHMKKEPRL